MAEIIRSQLIQFSFNFYQAHGGLKVAPQARKASRIRQRIAFGAPLNLNLNLNRNLISPASRLSKIMIKIKKKKPKNVKCTLAFALKSLGMFLYRSQCSK